MNITELEAIEIAKSYAKGRGWPWIEPVTITRRNHWYGPLYSYKVFTGCNGIGLNIRLEIKAQGGKILNGWFNPR